ncbi:MAG: VOC family protein [Dehalococcoidia bacterium]|nr:VOC family protein [Dehalococcoidia bacterium]
MRRSARGCVRSGANGMIAIPSSAPARPSACPKLKCRILAADSPAKEPAMFRSVHAQLLASDFAACFRFYQDTLGLEVAHGGADGPYAQFLVSGVMLTLVDQALVTKALGTTGGRRSLSRPDEAVLVLGVDDVDGLAASLKAKGLALVSEPTDRPIWELRTAHFRDPEGRLVEINQPLER